MPTAHPGRVAARLLALAGARSGASCASASVGQPLPAGAAVLGLIQALHAQPPTSQLQAALTGARQQQAAHSVAASLPALAHARGLFTAVPACAPATAAPALAEASSASDSEADAGCAGAGQLLSAADYRRQFRMWVDARDAPEPFQTFEQAELPPQLLKALLRHGFTAPTFIQAQAWPIAMQGRDLVAIASTGSGKTAGFLLPAFLHIQAQLRAQQAHAAAHGAPEPAAGSQRGRRGGGSWGRWNRPGAWGGAGANPPTALVLAPTRELAQQIQAEAERLGAPFSIRNACLYGGASRGPQGRDLSRGPQLIIATPGRLLDFVSSGELSVNRVSLMVLDEADRMLDMGFEPQIRELLSYMPGGEQAPPLAPNDAPVPPRQTLFFSATWPREVQAIARQLCRNDPVRVFVGDVQDKLVANRDVTQLVAMLSGPEDRLPALMDYLHEHLHGAERQLGAGAPAGQVDEVHPRVVVFAATKRDCDWLASELGRAGIRAVAVHGDKSQYERDHALQAFRRGRFPVLVATDVAARGLDVPGVTAVVNHTFPAGDHEMYIHRIGRTGRAGRKGEALTLLTPADAPVTPVLTQIMRDAGQTVPPELEAVAARVRRPATNKHRYGSGAGARGGRSGGGWGGRGRAPGRGGDRWGDRGGRDGGGGSSSSSWGGGGGRHERGERRPRSSEGWGGGGAGGSSRGRGSSAAGGEDSWGEVLGGGGGGRRAVAHGSGEPW